MIPFHRFMKCRALEIICDDLSPVPLSIIEMQREASFSSLPHAGWDWATVASFLGPVATCPLGPLAPLLSNLWLR